MAIVYAFPPVGVIAGYWTQEQPTSRSRSLLTGREFVSSAQRKRLVAGLTVHGRRQYGSGYLEALWRLLDGGEHLVRLTACRIPWGRTVDNVSRAGSYFSWTLPSTPIGWVSDGDPFYWFSGAMLTGTINTSGHFAKITVTGLPANAVVAIPGEFLTIHLEGGDEQHMIANEVVSNASGVAVANLVSTPSAGGRVSFGSYETGVFRLQSDWPRAQRMAGSTEPYSLDFRQVFEDEEGFFQDVNPWI